MSSLIQIPTTYQERLDSIDRRIRERAEAKLAEAKITVHEIELRVEVVNLLGDSDLIDEVARLRQEATDSLDRLECYFAALTSKTNTKVEQKAVVELPSPPVVETSIVEDVAPVLDPEPEPVAQVPKATAKSSTSHLREQKNRLTQERSRFLRLVGELADGDRNDRVLTARRKAAACLGRAVIALSEKLGVDAETSEAGLRSLGQNLGYFPAFARSCSGDYDRWFQTREAYDLVACAEECMQELERCPCLEDPELHLIQLCAAAQAYAFRSLPELDPDLKHMRDQLESLKPVDLYVKYWKLAENGGPTRSEVAEDARALTSEWSAYRSRRRKMNSKQAVEALVQAIEESRDDVEAKVLAAAQQCLDSGVAPSDKLLRKAFLPYRACLAGLTGSHADKFLEYLRKDETLLTQKTDPALEQDADPTPDSEDQLTAVREILGGKTLLLVGGRTDPHRKKALQEELGLKELDWPSTTDDTRPTYFDPFVRKADVVCLLIRWSRHSYKDVLDLAKSRGKQTVVIKAGIGLRRFVHDVHHQLVENA